MIVKLNKLYPNNLMVPIDLNQIPKNGYMVYILLFNNIPIVLGHGQKNRAKIIFDNVNQITTGHLKALFVRLYILFGKGEFERCIITCQNKDEAKEIERNLHRQFGGNNRNLPEEIRKQLFNGIELNSVTHLVLEIALRSSFDGLSDIKKWKSDGILSENVWAEISEKLKLT